jgi:GT2 family glycosyltransferase
MATVPSVGDRPDLLGGERFPGWRPTIGIVLLNWNRFDLVAACIDSIRRSDYTETKIVVVDNGSSDDSPARLKDAFPEIHLIENGRNLGFARANNVGIGWLMSVGVDCALLLNDDTEISPDMLSLLVDALYADTSIGVVGPKINYFGDRDRIWFAGGTVDKWGQASHLGADELDPGEQEQERDVDYITGCALMIKRAVLETVGYLDERFFIYYEETEYCARVRASGYRIVIVPQAKMWHKVRPGDRPSSPVYLYLMARNRLLYLRCTGASALTILVATLAIVRTAASWALRPRHRAMRRHAGTLLAAVRDFWLGRFGAPPAAVQQRQSCPTTPGGRPTSQPA